MDSPRVPCIVPEPGDDLQIAALRRLSGLERMRIGFELYELSRQLVELGYGTDIPQLPKRRCNAGWPS